MAHNEAISCVPQMVTYAVIKKGKEYKENKSKFW